MPDGRLTGDPDWDRYMRLNLYVPSDPGPAHPVVMLVHGGGYGSGDKNEDNGLYKAGPARLLLKRGYAVVTLNYVLEPAGIFPQAFRDYRTAVRFLRANASRSRLGARFLPYLPRKKDAVTVFPEDLRLGEVTRELSGTPRTSGRYWLQVWVGPDEGRLRPPPAGT